MKNGSSYFKWFFLLIFPLLSFSQKDSLAKPSKFIVSSIDFTIFPSDNYLFIGSDNHIKITPSIKGVKFSCKITNGKITMLKDSTFVITNALPVNTLLSIYTKDVNGKEHLALTKIYNYVPFPSVKISGVRSDSAITRLMLAVGAFYADFKGIGKVPIRSFKMEMMVGNQFVKDSSSTGQLTKKMLQYISTIKPGTILYFSDLKYKTSDGKYKTEPIYRVFIIPDEPNPIQFGL